MSHCAVQYAMLGKAVDSGDTEMWG